MTLVPAHLIDPRTNKVIFCREALTLVKQRLSDGINLPLNEALAGFESLFGDIFQNLNFSGCDFMTHSLKGMCFDGGAFQGCKFDFAQIVGASFRGADVDRDALRLAIDWPDAVAEDCARLLAASGTNRLRPSLRAPLFHPWRTFSEAHHLPQWVVLPQDLKVTDIPKAQLAALRVGRLAIMRHPLLEIEYLAFTDGDDAPDKQRLHWKSPIAEAVLQPAQVANDDVHGYIDDLTQQTGGIYALPSKDLLNAAQDAALIAGLSLRSADGPAELVQSPGNAPFKLGTMNQTVIFNADLPFDKTALRLVRIFEE